MRINMISVKKLFGMFDYTIPLNLEKRATIIIGPNGYGKTTILKMVNGIFNGNLSILFRVPFNEFTIDFDNTSKIQLVKKKRNKKNNRDILDLFLTYSELGEEIKSINLTDIGSEKNREFLFYASDMLRDEYVDRSTLRLLRAGGDFQNIENIFSIYEKIYDMVSRETNYGEKRSSRLHFPAFLHSEFGEKLQAIMQITRTLNVHFIQTQRLISYTSQEKAERSEKETPVVNMYSNALAKDIETTLAQSSQQAQKLDSTFPRRVITNPPPQGTKDAYQKLLKELEDLRNKRIHLRDTGILVDLGDDLEITESIDDINRLNYLNGVLTEYINDTRIKLAIFDELAGKIELLKKIINERFSYKKLEISKDKGFIFMTTLGEELPPDALSSGEQHELVMFYEFLFKVPKGSLLLIDEPELSLHIDWQQRFLKDLIEIAELAGFDVVIATHAPSIINNFWSLAVDLGELEK